MGKARTILFDQTNEVRPSSPMVKRVSTAKKGSPSARGKKRGKFKGRPAPAPAPRRSKGGSKRSFRKFSVRDPFRPKGSDGAEVDASPFELSMNSVRLSKKTKVLGMDESRRKTQRRILWYWQFSRNWQVSKAWNWRQITEALSISPEKSARSDEEPDQGKKGKDWVWFWRWRDWQAKQKRRRKRSTGSLLLSPKHVRLIGILGDEKGSETLDTTSTRYGPKEPSKANTKQVIAKTNGLEKLLNESDRIEVSKRFNNNKPLLHNTNVLQ